MTAHCGAATCSGLLRRAAELVDKVLPGANPAEIPVERPTKFDLLINLIAAKAFALQISDKLLATADQRGAGPRCHVARANSSTLPRSGTCLRFGVIDFDHVMKSGNLENILDVISCVANSQLTSPVIQQLGCSKDHAQALAADVREISEVEEDPPVVVLDRLQQARSRVTRRRRVEHPGHPDDQHIADPAPVDIHGTIPAYEPAEKGFDVGECNDHSR